ncbi:MAG: hypothetical protein U5K84_11885 [Alkalibacterium sp.]|nr:hypothetical protein [Alkalibacterium sp.]
MKNKKWAMLSLAAMPLLLAGCDSENLDTMQEATDGIEQVSTEAVENLNQLFETEAQLQEQFTETLETDEDLATLSDGSSPVFENIDARGRNPH